MKSGERIQAAIDRKPVDRTPYALWRHFPEEDRTPEGLAAATLRFQERFGSDFIKLTYAGGYAVEDWGCVEAEKVEEDGHRPCARHAVNGPGDWARVKPLDPRRGGYGKALEALSRVVEGSRGEAPVIPTVFSPLSLARKLSGDRLGRDLKERPAEVEAALAAILETQVAFARACLEAGASGVFYSIQAAGAVHHTEEEYTRFGEPGDLAFLDSLRGLSRLTILHAHGKDLFFRRLAGLPAHAINWEDRATPPPLEEGLRLFPGAVIGGLDQWRTLRRGTPAQVKAEAQEAVARTGGQGLILGPGCVVPMGTPEANLDAVRS